MISNSMLDRYYGICINENDCGLNQPEYVEKADRNLFTMVCLLTAKVSSVLDFE